jgi:L-lactate dehydrogenase complex protein LldG
MSARERILARLRAAPATPEVAAPDVGAWFAVHTRREEAAERVARLRSNLLAAHAEVHDCSAASWASDLLAIAAAKGVRTLLIGQTAKGAELAACHPALELIRYDSPVDGWRDRLFDAIDAGFTRARSAIAETGSLILWPDAAEPRLLSLVPPIHFVLVDAAKIHADLHEAMASENWAAGLPTNALLISGPSKTADIQQTLAYGAHGPRELIVLLRHGEGEAA